MPTQNTVPHSLSAEGEHEQFQPKPRCIIYRTTPNGTPCTPSVYEGDDVELALSVYREQAEQLEQAKHAQYTGLSPLILEKMRQQRIEGFIDGKDIRWLSPSLA
jgi:hypothetical protein